MTFINLAPDAKGIETIARTFREGIAESLRKAKMAEELAENGLDRYDIYQPDLGLIQEGLYMIVNREEKNAISMQEGLDDCELALDGNRVLDNLRSVCDGGPISPDAVEEAIELIGKLAEKAGMKG